jgi:ABC-type multidrug transport system fused ATPase/permease subunit
MSPASWVTRLDSRVLRVHRPDVTLLANFFSQFTINILGNGLLVAGILIFMTRTNPWLGLGLTACCLATVGVLRALQQRAVHRNVTDRQASAEQHGTIGERLTATEAANLNPAAASRPQ